MTAEFNLLEVTLGPGDLAVTECRSTGPVDKNRILLDGALWVEGGDFGPVFADAPTKLTLGKAAASIHVETGINKFKLALIEAIGRAFGARLTAAQLLKHRLFAHLQGTLDALTAMPATPIDDALHSGSLQSLRWTDLFEASTLEKT